MTESVLQTLYGRIDKLPDISGIQDIEQSVDSSRRGTESEYRQWLRAERDARARAEAMLAEERTLRQSAEDWAKTECASKMAAEEKVMQLQGALAAEQATKSLLESQRTLAPVDAETDDAPQQIIDLAPIEAALAELTRTVATMQKTLGSQRHAPAPPVAPQPATYSFIPRRDGAGVIREIVATPV